jgi:hypothetical protein
MPRIPVVSTDLGGIQARPVILVNTAGQAYDMSGLSTPAPAPAPAAVTLPAGADRSGSIAEASKSQQLAAANPARQSLTGQNISAGDLWINETGGSAGQDLAGSFRVLAGQPFEINTSAKVSIWGLTAGQKFTATEG